MTSSVKTRTLRRQPPWNPRGVYRTDERGRYEITVRPGGLLEADEVADQRLLDPEHGVGVQGAFVVEQVGWSLVRSRGPRHWRGCAPPAMGWAPGVGQQHADRAVGRNRVGRGRSAGCHSGRVNAATAAAAPGRSSASPAPSGRAFWYRKPPTVDVARPRPVRTDLRKATVAAGTASGHDDWRNPRAPLNKGSPQC